MKKKQLFAVLLAGSMTVGMAPAAAFAAEDTGAGAAAAAEAQVTDDNTDNTDATDDSATADAEAQKQAEADAQAAAQAQAEAEAQAAAEAEAQKQAEEQAAAEAETQKQAEEQAAAEAEAQKQAEEQAAAEEKADKIVESAKELQDAIKNAPEYTGAIDATDVYDTAYKIKIGASFALENETIKIPSNRNIEIYGTEGVTTTISRGTVAGNMFEVSANSVFSITHNEGEENDPVGEIVIDGAKSDSTAAEGSIIKVNAESRFVMTTGVTLTNNVSSKVAGSAIDNSGEVLISGGEIKGNVSEKGAVYSTGMISLLRDIKATAEEPKIIDNYTSAEKTTKSNIVLGKDDSGNTGKIRISSTFIDSNIGFSVEKPDVDYVVFESSDGASLADAIGAMSYEGDINFKVDENGKLESNKLEVKIINTNSSTSKTATAVITSNKAGTYYYKCAAKEDDSVTIGDEDIVKGEEIVAGEEKTISLTDLTGKIVYLYVWVKADDGTVSETPAKATITLKQDNEKPDDNKTAPKITKASFSKWKDSTTATIKVTSDKAGQCYYKVVKRGAKKPALSSIKSHKAISKNEELTIDLTKLNSATDYDVYVYVKGNDKLNSTLTKIKVDKTIEVKWTGFKWTSHATATVKLVSNISGTCYYTWVERDQNGNSSVPDKSKITNTQPITKDSTLTLYLSDMDTDKAIDLYFYIKSDDGKSTGIKRLKFNEDTRPAKGADNHTPVTPPVTDSRIKGLSTNMEFYPNTFYPFEVIGAGTTNSDPGEGDWKWEPLYWSTSASPKDADKHSTWKIGSTKGISKGSKFSLYVFFQKWVYTGGKWTETDTISSARYEFGSVPITITPSAGAGANGANGSGGQTGSDPNATVTGAASETSSNGGNGTTSRNAVSTADNSPIGTMSALAVASILAGGYVIVRRRKKDI